MRAGACGLFLLAASAGCSSSTHDPCSGHAGACISLTVTSSQVKSVDTLRISASGAFTGTHDSVNGKPTALPATLALLAPAGATGVAHLHVDGLSGGVTVASGDHDAPALSATALHVAVTVDVEPAGGGDLGAGSDGGNDLAGGDGGVVVPCDPKGISGPQCVWRWQTPRPVGEDLTAVYAFGDNDIYAATRFGLILHRDANGWSYPTPQTSPPTGTFQPQALGGSPVSGTLGDLWAVGSTSTPTTSPTPAIYHTSDGVSWTADTLCGGGACTLPTGATMHAIAGQSIFSLAVGDQLLLVRNNSGDWTPPTTLPVAPSMIPILWGVSIAFGSAVAVGVNAGTNTAVLWQNDTSTGVGFKTWKAVTLAPALTGTLWGACSAISGGNASAWAVGDAGTIYYSNNFNTATPTWTKSAATAASVPLRGCVGIDAMHAIAYGAGGVVVATTNGGANWSGLSSGTSGALAAGSRSPQSSLTLVGQGGLILRSLNDTSFTNEQTGPTSGGAPIFGVAPGVVYALGTKAIRTTDDGATWQTVTLPSNVSLFTGWGSSATDVYIAGEKLMHSTDGTTFTAFANAPPVFAATPNQNNFSVVTGADKNNVFALALPNGSTTLAVFRSTDAGASWSQVGVTGLTGAPTALFAMGTSVWVGGTNAQIFLGTFAGAGAITWTRQTVTEGGNPLPSNATVQFLYGRPPSDLFATLLNIKFAHSTNATSPTGTWDAKNVTTSNPNVPDPGSENTTNIYVAPTGNEVWVGGSNGEMFLSTNEGPPASMTWTLPPLGVYYPGNMSGVFAFADNDIFVVPGTGGVIHYGN